MLLINALVGHKPLWEKGLSFMLPPEHGGTETEIDPGAVLPSDGFLAVGEHHHVCVHLVKLDTDICGDVVVLALARTITSLPCYLLGWLAVLRSGLLHAWPCYLPRVDLGKAGHASALAVQRDGFNLCAPQPVCHSSRVLACRECSARLFITCFPDC